jgi:hypothetical protein
LQWNHTVEGTYLKAACHLYLSLLFFCSLFAGLWILILGGFLQIFVGGELLETGMAIAGAFLFSGNLIWLIA